MRSVIFTLTCLLALSLSILPAAGIAVDEVRYQVNRRFGLETETLPKSWRLGVVSAVAVSDAEVFVCQRGKNAPPIVVFDKNGKYLRSWGWGDSKLATGGEHGVRLDSEGNVWVTRTDAHQVVKFNQQGKRLLTLGIEGKAGTDDKTFNRPTDIAFGSQGEFYVSDGYGNSRVVKFSKHGKYLKSWGEPGSGAGEFNTPHSIAVDSSGRVYVSDRGNRRIQIFDADGNYLKQWTGFGGTQNIFIKPNDEVWVVGYPYSGKSDFEGFGGRIMKVDIKTGKPLRTIESQGHWIHVTPKNDIFIGFLGGNVFHWYLQQ